MIGEMGLHSAHEFLAARNLGRLGCCLNNVPYVVPVYYLLADGCFYVHSLPGRKIEMLRANPQACLQVDAIEDAYHWRSVLADVVYEEIADADERDQWLTKFYSELPNHSPVESMMRHDADTCIVFPIADQKAQRCL